MVAGLLLIAGGVVAAVAFGPDDRLTSGRHTFTSRGVAVATAPTVLAYSGPTIELTATRKSSAPVFLGVGHHVDVADYLRRSAYTQIDSIDLPQHFSTSVVRGDRLPAAGPAGLDWWLVSDSGSGSARVVFPLPDDAVDVVAIDPKLRRGFEVMVTAAVIQEGAFVGGLAMSLAGVGLAVGGWVLRSGTAARNLRPAEPAHRAVRLEGEPGPDGLT